MKKVAERLSLLVVLVFAIGALAFLSASITSLTPAIAQQTTNTLRLNHLQKVVERLQLRNMSMDHLVVPMKLIRTHLR